MRRTRGARDRLRRGPSIPAYGVDIVPRDRLLQAVATAEVTEVVAPAGYGKTTLLASWARTTDDEVAWCTLTDADADPVRFTADLAAAFDEVAGPALGLLEPPALDTDLTAFVAALHDALGARGQRISLVLDDVHTVVGARRTLQLLDDFILGAPFQLRVVLAGRQAPPLRRQRLRLGGQLVSIGQDELAFTAQETAAVTRQALPGLGEQDTAEIHRATDGWPAAVRMWTLAAAGGVHARDTSADLTVHLVTAILGSLDETLRDFVLDASIDDSVCAPLLDEIRAAADSGPLLARCFQQGLFLTVGRSRDEGPAWYDWHQLFVAQVRRIAEGTDAARHRILEARAATWWRSVDTVTAVRHALRAGRPELAAEFTADAWPDLVLAGRTETVSELVRSVPPGLTREADMHLAAAFVEANRDDDEGARREQRLAEATARRLPEWERARFDARGAALSLMYLANDRASLQQIVARGHELLRRLEDGPWTPDPVTLTLTRLCVGMGEARLQQDNERALERLRSAATMAQEQGLTALGLVAQAETCIPLIVTGAFGEAGDLAEHVLSSAAAKGWGTPRALAPAVAYRGWLAYWTGRPEPARQGLSDALALFHRSDVTLVGITTYFRAQASLHLGDLTAAEADLEALRSMEPNRGVPPYWPSLLRALDAEVALAQGRDADARRHALARTPGKQYRLATVSRARVLLHVGSPEEAVALLDNVDPSDRFTHVEVFVERLRAEALWRQEHRDEALRALDRALAAAAPLRLLLPFQVDGDTLAPVLLALRDQGTTHEEMLTRVLNTLEEHGAGRLPWGEQLSNRELTVLRYLRTTLTLPEIAAAEGVSVNTVKTHVGSVYRKLGVGGRREAVQAATGLGIR